MKPLQLTVLLHLAFSCAAILIPRSLPDGVYSVENPRPDGSGNRKRSNTTPRFVRHDNNISSTLASLPRGALSGLAPRGWVHTPRRNDVMLSEKVPLPITKHWCWEDHEYKPADVRLAVNDLFTTPLFWVPPSEARFALRGSVVVFVCNWGHWNAVSLVEYMAASDSLDKQCGAGLGGKVALPKWGKFYGRESLGEEICEWETEPGGIRNDALKVQKLGCRTYVNGVTRWLGGDPGPCNQNGGWGIIEKTKKIFPWWHRDPKDAAVEGPTPQSEADEAETEKGK